MTICAALIVKDESSVIGRCLDSLRDHIDYWVIADTGSSDNTKEIIKNKLSSIPGELHDHAWKNFGKNRTRLIRHCKGKADYVLVLDADMVLNVLDEDFKKDLTADAYYLKYTGDLDYSQELLVSGRLDWEYRGVTHEYIYSKEAKEVVPLSKLSVTHFCDGKRRPKKFEDDILLLKEGLERAPDNDRYVFYLAQSYFDIGKYNEAAKWYKKRVALGGWKEEVYISMLRAAQAEINMGEFPLGDLIKAHEYRPTRLEAMYLIIRHLREKNHHHTAYYLCKSAIDIPYPSNDVLFIEKNIYNYCLMDELSVCSYWVGKYQESADLCDRLLSRGDIPNIEMKRIKNNKKLAEQYLNRLPEYSIELV